MSLSLVCCGLTHIYLDNYENICMNMWQRHVARSKLYANYVFVYVDINGHSEKAAAGIKLLAHVDNIGKLVSTFQC